MSEFGNSLLDYQARNAGDEAYMKSIELQNRTLEDADRLKAKAQEQFEPTKEALSVIGGEMTGDGLRGVLEDVKKKLYKKSKKIIGDTIKPLVDDTIDKTKQGVRDAISASKAKAGDVLNLLRNQKAIAHENIKNASASINVPENIEKAKQIARENVEKARLEGNARLDKIKEQGDKNIKAVQQEADTRIKQANEAVEASKNESDDVKAMVLSRRQKEIAKAQDALKRAKEEATMNIQNASDEIERNMEESAKPQHAFVKRVRNLEVLPDEPAPEGYMAKFKNLFSRKTNVGDRVFQKPELPKPEDGTSLLAKLRQPYEEKMKTIASAVERRGRDIVPELPKENPVDLDRIRALTSAPDLGMPKLTGINPTDEVFANYFKNGVDAEPATGFSDFSIFRDPEALKGLSSYKQLTNDELQQRTKLLGDRNKALDPSAWKSYLAQKKQEAEDKAFEAFTGDEEGVGLPPPPKIMEEARAIGGSDVDAGALLKNMKVGLEEERAKIKPWELLNKNKTNAVNSISEQLLDKKKSLRKITNLTNQAESDIIPDLQTLKESSSSVVNDKLNKLKNAKTAVTDKIMSADEMKAPLSKAQVKAKALMEQSLPSFEQPLEMKERIMNPNLTDFLSNTEDAGLEGKLSKVSEIGKNINTMGVDALAKIAPQTDIVSKMNAVNDFTNDGESMVRNLGGTASDLIADSAKSAGDSLLKSAGERVAGELGGELLEQGGGWDIGADLVDVGLGLAQLLPALLHKTHSNAPPPPAPISQGASYGV